MLVVHGEWLQSVGMENEITVATSRGPVRFHSVGNAIAGIPAKYVKVRFTGKAGETAGIVIEAAKAKAMSIPDLSRLFPYSESGKMSRVHTSPEFASWDEAFAFSFN